MWCSLERELQIPLKGRLLDPKEEPQEVMEQPQVEEERMETTTQVEPSIEGKKRTTEAQRLMKDARENVGSPSNQHRKRRSAD